MVTAYYSITYTIDITGRTMRVTGHHNINSSGEDMALIAMHLVMDNMKNLPKVKVWGIALKWRAQYIEVQAAGYPTYTLYK